MGKISVKLLKPGMVLADQVRDHNGRLLMNAGQAITESHLRVLRIWGVVEVDVEGLTREHLEEEDLAAIEEKFLAKAEEIVRERFRYNDASYAPVKELMHVATMRKVRELYQTSLGSPVDNRKTQNTPPKNWQGDACKLLPAIKPQHLVREDMTLGSLPMVFHKLVEVVNNPHSSAMDVADIISNDIDLSARLLRMVNSPFYGLRSKIDTISRAVTIIGGNQLVSLALGMSVVSTFKGISNEFVDMDMFWKHSISCGICARYLSSYHKTPNTERFFVAGLLHDVGRLVIYEDGADYAARAFALAREKNMLLHRAEVEVMGFSHQDLGGMILEKWQLPISLEKCVRYHHDPLKAPQPRDAAIMQVADAFSGALEHGTSGESFVPTLTPEAWELVDLPVNIIPQIAMDTDFQLGEIVSFFLRKDD